MSAFPAIARPCIEEAVARSARMIEHAIDIAAVSMRDESIRSRDSASRQELALATAELTQSRVVWCSGYPSALRRAVESADVAPRPLRVNPSSLTLVDDGDVVQSIESSRLSQKLESLLDKPLAQLDRYMSSALSLEGIQPERNPLRPAVFAQALRSLMNPPANSNGWPDLWMRHMAIPLAEELQGVYQTCVQLLERAKVQPADYRVITSPAPLEARESRSSPLERTPSGAVPLHGGKSSSRSAISGWVELATRALSAPVLREFLSGSSRQAQQPLAPDYYRHVDEELAALEARHDEIAPDPQAAQRYRHLPAVDRPVREVGTATALSREAWGDYSAPRQRSLVRTRLRKQAQHVGQVMGLDLVRQLVDQVAQDPRLLAPVREAIVAVEPALARLALNSPRFFAEHDNPARRLLESVAQRSFRFNDEFSTEFGEFFDGVRAQFKALNGLETLADTAPFEQALARLAGEWSQHDSAEQAQHEHVLEAVLQAEQRQTEAERIAWELSQRSDLNGAPSLVQDFLFGPWSLVIAQARLDNAGTELDPGGYIGVITDLLWSVKQEATLRDPARAFEVIPRVLPKLRAGLDLLGQSPAETRDFFHALERLHSPVLKLRAKHRHQSLHPELASAALDEDLQPAPAQKPQARDELWLRDGELRTFGFEDTLPSDYAALEEPAPRRTQAAATPAPSVAAAAVALAPASARVTPTIPVVTVAGVPLAAPQADAVIATLQEGCWVDLYSKQRWRRARLTWASGRRTLFMFVSQGGRPHSMTRRSMQRLVMNRLLRPVDSHEVVQHALDTLVHPRNDELAA